MDTNKLTQRLNSIVGLSQSWFWETDNAGRFSWFSDNVERLTGVEPSWHYGKKRTDILALADIDQDYLANHLRCLDQHESFKKFVYRRQGPNGDSWISVDGEPCFDNLGNFTGYRGCGTVVTEQHLSEKHQSQLIEGLNAMDQGLLVFDEEEHLIFLNRQIKEYFELDEVLTTTVKGISFTHFITSQVESGMIQEAIGNEKSWLESRIQTFRNASGTSFYQLANGRQLRSEHFKTDNKETIVTMQDIGALLEAEEQVKTVQNLLLTAIDGFSGGMALYDLDGRLLIANQRYSDFYPEIDRVEIGDNFENLLRQRLAGQGIPSAIGCEEQWLADRMALFNDPEETVMDLDYKNGKWVHIREQRTPVGTFRTLTDSSHSKNLELELKSSKDRFRDFAECAADVFWESDVGFNYSYIDGRFKELLGLSEHAVVGQPLTLLNLPDSQFVKSRDVRIKDTVRYHYGDFEQISFRYIQPDGTLKIFSMSGKARFTETGDFQGYRGTLTDITESYQLNLKLHHQANHDDLTDLFNRRSFNSQLESAFKLTKSLNLNHVLCYIDLDQFKIINDSAGHIAGDHLLKQIARLLRETIGNKHVLARLGGDEFGLLLINCSLEEASATAERMVRQLSNYRFTWNRKTYRIGASVGMVEICSKSISAEQVMNDADLACYTAKDRGRNRVYVYQSDDPGLIKRRAEIVEVNEIHNAMRTEGRLQMYCQPIVSTLNSQHACKRYELLLRVFDRQGKMRLPGLFISAAERYNLMTELDQWVIQKSFQQFKPLLESDPELQISINLSGISVSDPEFHQFVQSAFSSTGCPANQICFEITETAAIENLSEALKFITSMKSLGCKFALDDFGSGLSSLSQLERLPVDYVKIDGDLIEKLTDSEVNRVIVASICNIAKLMGIEVVGEYVETIETYELLRELGVDHAQGYLFSKPAPVEHFWVGEALEEFPVAV